MKTGIMVVSITLVVCLRLLAQDVPDQVRESIVTVRHGINSIIQHENHTVQIDTSWITNAPSWNQEKEDTPPLSARTALRQAHSRLAKTVDDASAWDLQSLQLRPHDETHWFYVAEFSRPSKKQDQPGYFYLDSIRIAVSMNGETITPDIGSQQPPERDK